MATEMTNAAFSVTDVPFLLACRLVGIQATARQASRWRRGCGLAWTQRSAATRLAPFLSIQCFRVDPGRALRIATYLERRADRRARGRAA